MAAVSEVAAAVRALYQSSDAASRSQAHAWLEQFRRTSEAWTAADVLLGDATQDAAVHLFAAQTLRSKIVDSLDEVDAGAQRQLRDTLAQRLRRLGGGPGTQAVATQLSLCLADIAVQMEAWDDPLGDMAAALLEPGDAAEQQQQRRHVARLVEFAGVLPEELCNERLPGTGEYFVRRAAALLTRRAGDVLQLLAQSLAQAQPADAATQTRVLVCFTAWVRSGEVAVDQAAASAAAELAFAALQADDAPADVFEAAVDAACSLVRETRDDADDAPASAAAKDAAVGRSVAPQLAAAAATLGRGCPATDAAERARGLCRVLTEAGEAWLARIVAASAEYAGLVAALVACMRSAPLDALPMMFDFWGRLADALLAHTAPCDAARRTLAAAYAALVDVILLHVRHPAEEAAADGGAAGAAAAAATTAAEREAFREFRHGIGDVLKDCVRVVGQQAALERVWQALAEALRAADLAGGGGWQRVEAALFALRAMGAEVSADEASVLPRVMDALAQLPMDALHARLRYAATLVLARYTEWTSAHPAYLAFQLRFISAGFGHKDVAAASAQALKYLCQDCAAQMAPHAPELLAFFAAHALDPADAADVAEALAHVVSALEPADAAQALELVCRPALAELDAALAQPLPQPQVAHVLDRMGVFLRFVHAEDAGVRGMLDGLAADLVPRALAAVQQQQQQQPAAAAAQVAESACRLMRVAFEFHAESARVQALVEPVVAACAQAFGATGLAVHLWLGRRILGAAGLLAPAVAPQMAASVAQHMVQAALARFARRPLAAEPEAAEDLFRLAERAVERAPAHVLPAAWFAPMLMLALEALDPAQQVLVHVHAHAALLALWLQVLGPARRHVRRMHDAADAGAAGYPVGFVVDLVGAHGARLVAHVLLGLLAARDRENSRDAAELLAAVCAVAADGPAVVAARFDQPPAAAVPCGWAAAALAQVPDPPLPLADARRFLDALAAAVAARQWPRITTLATDLAATFWRRNTDDF
ncbi:Nuclear import receptor [Coemansia erecta]|uniref:Nuclear import receptor n=1 Tax=Coemansia erecta TaxID=147472 RepID=A0A9W7Y8C6_9FUNG|nr:Nuclear import receptor [Coemansia erecta]